MLVFPTVQPVFTLTCLGFDHVFISPSRKSFSTISSMSCRARLQNIFWLSYLLFFGAFGASLGGALLCSHADLMPDLQLNTWLSTVKKGRSCSMLRIPKRVRVKRPGSHANVRLETSSSVLFWKTGQSVSPSIALHRCVTGPLLGVQTLKSFLLFFTKTKTTDYKSERQDTAHH